MNAGYAKNLQRELLEGSRIRVTVKTTIHDKINDNPYELMAGDMGELQDVTLCSPPVFGRNYRFDVQWPRWENPVSYKDDDLFVITPDDFEFQIISKTVEQQKLPF